MLNLLKQSQIPIAICIFIDGLDEFEGQEDAVIKMIDDLADQTHVKVCVSSRPLLAFEEAFSEKPSLRLQDLTFENIREYADFKLSEPIQKYVPPTKDQRTQSEDLVNRIVLRANGVFLWAIIAIRDLYDGLRGIANIDELAQTLESLPPEVESLYMLMLQRIKPAFKRDGAYFLQIAMYQEGIYRDRMNLCRLHFSHSQRELKDRPVHYQEITTSELVTACHTLEIRLLSHTAGLLELTDPGKSLRIFGEREGQDPILFMNINFLHRTARDFLFRNDEANSFLADYGCSEAQVRLSIARGTLAQVARLSQGDIKCVDDEWPNPVYYPFLASLEQISKVEQILGAAQTNLMQSLNYESLAPGSRVSAKNKSYWHRQRAPHAFMISGIFATSIDQVGMAAYLGMTRYVCEQLDLSVESPGYPLSFPDRSNYSRSKRTTTTLAWTGITESQNQNAGLAVRLRLSKYRQAIGECLQWTSDTQWSSQNEYLLENNLLAVTYMLCCCNDTRTSDIARVLLRAGANPMVRVKPIGTKHHEVESDAVFSFWDRWLFYLLFLRKEHLEASGSFARFELGDQAIEGNMTSNDIFDVTKALLANGADINYQVDQVDSYGNDFLKGTHLEYERFHVSLIASALFVLEECFGTESEFREFAVAVEALVERPTRKIVAIELSESLYTVPRLSYKEANPRPSAEESEMLLSLIEKWEDTGRREDQDALQAALEGVWRAYNPGVELREMSNDWSDDESTSREDDDDNDDENDDEYDEEEDHEKGAGY